MKRQRWEESAKRRAEEGRSEKRKSQKKEGADGRGGKVGTSRNTVFFQSFVAPEGQKVGSLKRQVRAESSGEMRDEKLHAVVARSTFRSQNAQNTTCSDHFWMLRCGKSARSCGAKHMSKSKCTKHTSVGALLEDKMLKKVHVVVA